MFPQSSLRVPVAPQWPATSNGLLAVVAETGWNATRDTWMAAFSDRFAELRPDEDEEVVRSLAEELWPDVGGHDPLICAEMEHESTRGD